MAKRKYLEMRVANQNYIYGKAFSDRRVSTLEVIKTA
jgi:hypothetical protein